MTAWTNGGVPSALKRRFGAAGRKPLTVLVIACLVLVLGVGTAFAAYAWSQYSGWYGSHAAYRSKVATGDFNGDGKDDVVSLYDRGNGKTSIYVFRSGGSSFTSRSSWWYGSLTASKCKLAVTDTNGDGKDDLLVLYNRGSGSSTIYRFGSTGSAFSKSTMYVSPKYKLYWSRSTLTAGDVNADGMGEAIVQYDRGSGKSSLYIYKAPTAPVRGSVVNASNNLALGSVLVRFYNGSVFAGQATTAGDGSYSVVLPAGTYRAVFSGTGFRDVTYNNIQVVSGVNRFLETVRMVTSASNTPGNIGGTITDAFSGLGVGGVSVSLRSGIESYMGPVEVGPVLTNSSGVYSFAGLAPGVYTAELTAAGRSTTHFTVVCLPGTTSGSQNGTISQLLAAGQMRAVLTWGSTPSDLDSHLTFYPSGSSTQRWHIYYSNKITSLVPTAALDHDDTTSYGPETVTISNKSASGTYRYSIYDYSHAGQQPAAGVVGLNASGAKVQLYTSSGLIATYNVPSNQSGGLWKVFEIRNGTIVPINTLSNISTGSGSVP